MVAGDPVLLLPAPMRLLSAARAAAPEEEMSEKKVEPGLTLLRREVLAVLLEFGRNERGGGVLLLSSEIAERLRPILGFEVRPREASQAARFFARARPREREDDPEWLLKWSNPNGRGEAAFGLRVERTDEDVRRVVAEHDGRLVADALERTRAGDGASERIREVLRGILTAVQFEWKPASQRYEGDLEILLKDEYWNGCDRVIVKILGRKTMFEIFDSRFEDLARAVHAEGPGLPPPTVEIEVEVVDGVLLFLRKLSRGPDSEMAEGTPEIERENDPDFSERPVGAPDVDYVSRPGQDVGGLGKQFKADDRPPDEINDQFAAKPVERPFDASEVAAYVERISVELEGCGPEAAFAILGEFLYRDWDGDGNGDAWGLPPEFAALPPRARASVLFKLADSAAEAVRRRAREWVAVARDAERKGATG